MAQAGDGGGQNGTVERPYGQYSAHEQGNSLVTTVPCAVNLNVDTPVRMREARYRGRVVFLKAIPLTAEVAGRPGTRPETTTYGGEELTEKKIDIYSIWGSEGAGENPAEDATSGKRLVTLPKKCETDRFTDDTEPMVVAGMVEEEVVYLKIIPECLYQLAGSIRTADLIEASCSELDTAL